MSRGACLLYSEVETVYESALLVSSQTLYSLLRPLKDICKRYGETHRDWTVLMSMQVRDTLLEPIIESGTAFTISSPSWLQCSFSFFSRQDSPKRYSLLLLLFKLA